tara:strand:- start:164 stop:595 length:432 start_codon:yes stop_codon:yes gene_type:complete
MAHFAKLNANNIVESVMVISDSNSGGGTVGSEATGIAFCRNHVGDNSTNWKLTSYNRDFRGNYAGIGMTYMTGVRTLGVASTDVFMPQKPYPSWSVGINTAEWYSPKGPHPALTISEMAEGKYYRWDEAAYQADNNVGWALTN